MFKKYGIASGLMLAAGSAVAAVPAAVGTAFTDLTTDVDTVMGFVWGAVVLITSGFVLVRLVKKGMNRSA